MKAAWTNLVTGFADDSADLDKLIGKLTDSVVGYTDESGKQVKGVLDNLLPAIEKSLGGIAL
jgi:transcription termination factor NusB